jgi:hypothetical protein
LNFFLKSIGIRTSEYPTEVRKRVVDFSQSDAQRADTGVNLK